jgi:aryl-alcohol dehydrogenase-like predicted oxidoreductase
MQNHYNLVYREEEREMLPLCEAEGVGTIPWSPLARGLLAGKRKSREDRTVSTRAGSDSYTDELYDQPSDWEVVEATLAVAAKRGIGAAEVALAWLLSRPTVVAPIIGATKLEHLEAAIRALDLELTAEEKAQLEKPYRPHPVKGWT